MKYWLMKSEPNEFSLQDLASRPQQTEPWDGVRNYQARNFMRAMEIGDLVLFYHSNCTPPGIVGLAKVVAKAHPDPTQFDPDNKHYDPKSKPENPRWDLVDIQFVRAFKEKIPLDKLRTLPGLDTDFPLLRRANRLSVMNVEKKYWDAIMQVAEDA